MTVSRRWSSMCPAIPCLACRSCSRRRLRQLSATTALTDASGYATRHLTHDLARLDRHRDAPAPRHRRSHGHRVGGADRHDHRAGYRHGWRRPSRYTVDSYRRRRWRAPRQVQSLTGRLWRRRRQTLGSNVTGSVGADAHVSAGARLHHHGDARPTSSGNTGIASDVDRHRPPAAADRHPGRGDTDPNTTQRSTSISVTADREPRRLRKSSASCVTLQDGTVIYSGTAAEQLRLSVRRRGTYTLDGARSPIRTVRPQRQRRRQSW